MSRPKLFKERASINIYFDREDLDRLGKVAISKQVSRGELIRKIVSREVNLMDV